MIMILLPAESVRTSNVMPREDPAKVIAEIVERVSGSPAAGLAPESTFGDDLGIDSLTMMEIVVAVEDRFGVRVNDDDIEGLRTIGDAADYIERARVGV